MTKMNKLFTTSINPKFDIGNVTFIDRYLPTPSHADFIKNILTSFQVKQNSNSHIMIGPYGSGKSLAATIIADIFSGKVKEKEIKKLANKFMDVDQDITEKINNANNIISTYVPVVLSGYEGPFSNAIINSILRTLNQNDIEIEFSSVSKNIEDTLNLWEQNFKSAYNQFKLLLKRKNTTPKKWITLVRQNDHIELEWFKNVYPLLTAGAQFQVTYDGVFLESLKEISEELAKKNYKLFIIYDEFGRFLQSLDTLLLYKTMQDLQDMAEFANRSNGRLQFLLISHKNMSHYLTNLDAQNKNEFQRIEKRFSTYFIDSDKATFYRIAQTYAKSLQEEMLLLNFEDEISKQILRKYNLFSELNHQEVEKLIIEGSYPIHPITLFLIPRLSSIFGQNERTLFTFLESEETGGLQNHLQKEKNKPYLSHHLFDYFFSGDVREFISDDLYLPLRTFSKIVNGKKLSSKNADLLNILKLLTMWELSNANSVIKLNEELISYAINITPQETEKFLNELKNLKLIRYNRIISKWELNEGSSAVIEELINNERNDMTITDQLRLEQLTKVLENKFFLATDYNNEKSMTRFYKVRFQLLSSLKSDISNLKMDEADGYVIYSINDLDEIGISENILSLSSTTPLIIATGEENFKKISKEIDRVILLEKLLANKKVLSEYNQLEEEVKVLIEEAKYELQQYNRAFEEFNNGTKWFLNNEEIEITSVIDLENVISSEMFSLFPEAPEIRNDSINRRKLNSMQTKAIRKVLNQVIDYPLMPNIGIEGQGPDYLVYATVFKNNGIDFRDLEDSIEGPLLNLRNKLLFTLSNNPKGNLLKLKKIFIQEPFGIREPLIPILFVALIRDIWDQLIFFRNDMFVTSLDAEKVYGIFEEAEEYDYHFHNYEKEFLRFVSQVEEMFSEFMSEYVKDQTPVIKASSSLLGWLRHLPRYTQMTEKIDEKTIFFKKLIRQVEVSPLLNLTELMSGFNLDEIKKIKEQLENEFFKLKETIKSYMLQVFEVSTENDFFDKVISYESYKIKHNPLLSHINIADDNWVENFTESFTGIELRNWTDTTFELFKNQVQNDYKNIDSQNIDESALILSVGDTTKVIREVELSTKAKTIFENVNRTIINAGRSVPREEIEFMVYQLVKNYIK